MLQVPVLRALEAARVGIGPEGVGTMTAQPDPMPADNSTLLSRLEQLRQQVAATNLPDEVRAHLVQTVDEAIAAMQGISDEAMQLVTAGRAIDAYDDFKDIVEQLLSAYKRIQRWPVAWLDRRWR